MFSMLDTVYNDLVDAAEKLGLTPPRFIPRGSTQSQSYEFFLGKRPLLLIALRSVAEIPDYSGKDRLWVEGLDGILGRYSELLRKGISYDQLPPSVAVVLDNQTRSLVPVPLRDLAKTHFLRVREVGAPNARFTFMLRRRKGSYVLEGAYGAADVELRSYGTVAPVVNLLKSLIERERATNRGSSPPTGEQSEPPQGNS